MRKLDIKKIVESMKPVKNIKKIPPIKSASEMIDGVRVRDMRRESRDLGSYQADEFFGDSKT